MQAVCDPQGREYLYILSIYLPRFLNTSLEEKLATLLHELWHIGPNFDGDLRRFPGRNYAHGNSQREYDAQMERFAQQWLAADPPAHLYEFLEYDFHELVAEHGRIIGTPLAIAEVDSGVKRNVATVARGWMTCSHDLGLPTSLRLREALHALTERSYLREYAVLRTVLAPTADIAAGRQKPYPPRHSRGPRSAARPLKS